MNKKIILTLATLIVGSGCPTNHAEIKMICLENARSGEDQKLYGYYHTSYATSDNYHCYFTFDQQDIELITRGESKNRPDLQKLPYLPSYQAKVVYFINSSPYLNLIEALKTPGKTSNHLKQILGFPQAPTAESWQDVKTKLTE